MNVELISLISLFYRKSVGLLNTYLLFILLLLSILVATSTDVLAQSLRKPTIITANGKTVITISKPAYLDPFATVIKLTVKSKGIANSVQKID